jgi:hypothetical protein
MTESRIEPLVARIHEVLEPHADVLEAYLFGSVTRGEHQPHSDLDVALYLAPASEDRSGFGPAADFGAVLSKALGRNDVDVVILNDAPPLLYHRVLRDGVRVLSRDLSATTTREGWALSRYCDYAIQLQKIERAHQARIAAGAFGR